MAKKDEHVIKAESINAVLLKVREVEPFEGELQLGTLAFALVLACRSCGVDKHAALRRIREAFNTPINTAPLPPAAAKPH